MKIFRHTSFVKKLNKNFQYEHTSINDQQDVHHAIKDDKIFKSDIIINFEQVQMY